jgi:hypothetical protein
MPEVFAKTALATTKRLSQHLATSERLGAELLEAIVGSGVLDEQIEGLKEKRFEEYVETHAAEAQSRISERVKEKQRQHDALSAEVERLTAFLKQERDEKLASVEDEIQKLRANANAEIDRERQRLDEQRKALHREQETLAKTVSQAAARFGEGRSALLSDLLALLPALQATGVLQTPAAPQTEPGLHEKLTAPASLPAPFVITHAEPSKRLDERTFFDRFARHIQDSGFRYRHAGLQQRTNADAPVEGPPVLLADFQAWLGGEGQWPVEVATLFDSLNPPLLRLGAPITARRASAIRRLLASSALLLPEQVLDVAIATRVLPLLRGLNRHSGRQDADQILELLAAAPGGCHDSCQLLSSMIAQQQEEWQEMLEDE